MIPDTIAAALDLAAAKAQAAAAAVAEARRLIDRDWPPSPPSDPPPPPVGRFAVVAGRILDPDGKPWRAVGWNCTGAASYHPWPAQWDPHGKAALWQSWGCTAIRHVLYERPGGRLNHPTSGRYSGTLDDLIAEYTARRIVVIVDFHEGGLGGPWTDAEVERASEILAGLAAKHRDNPWVWWEPRNEPLDEGGPSSQEWLDKSRRVALAIRATGNTAPVVLCEGNFGQGRGYQGQRDIAAESGLIRWADQLRDLGTIIGDVHVYSRWANATDADLARYFELVASRGIPVLVGEAGAYTAGWELAPGDRAGGERLLRVAGTAKLAGILPWMHGDPDPARAEQGSIWSGFWSWARGSTPTPPTPPADVPRVTEVLLEPRPAAIRLVWQTSTTPGVTGHVVAWGANGGFLGSADLPAGTREHTITGLTPGVEHTIDVMVRTAAGPRPEDKVTRTATPLPVAVEQVSTPWRARRDAIVAAAGSRDEPGRLVLAPHASDTFLADGDLANVTVRGLIYHRHPRPLRLTNVRCQGVWCAPGAGPVIAERVTVEANPARPGQGAGFLLGNSTGWSLTRCDISGHPDGVQAIGPGLIEGCWIHDVAVGRTPDGGPTHNDGVTCFGGLITIRGTVIEMPRSETQVNGALWADGGDFDVAGSILTAPVQVLNSRAGRTIRLSGCHVEGRRAGAGTVIDG